MSKGAVIGFIFGAVASGAATWFVTKKYYRFIAEEEIASVKTHFTVPLDKNAKKERKEESPKEEPTIKTFTKSSIDDKKISAEHVSYEQKYMKVPSNEYPSPYIIDPDEAGMEEGYSVEVLTYYEMDGVLADDVNDMILNVAEMVGTNALDKFKDDAVKEVFVRNEKFKMDYDICRDRRAYKDVAND